MRKAKAAPVRSSRSKADLSGDLRIGISGWTYRPWRGVFYPPKHPKKRELEYASRAFNTIEINGTFYSLQCASSFQKWYSETPAGFVFSIKGARFLTHMKKLRDVAVPLANFFASGSFACAKNWDRFSGNSRLTLAGTKGGSANFSKCSRAIRKRPRSWRSSITKS